MEILWNWFFTILLNFDRSLFKIINTGLANPIFNSFFPFITDLHKDPYYAVPISILVIILFARPYNLKIGLILFSILLIDLSLTDYTGNVFFKRTFQRLRPNEAGVKPIQVRSPSGGFSFISNHAANTTAFARYVGFVVPEVQPLVFTVAILVGYSRIYNGVHFPSDVLFGAIWGFFVSSFFVYLAGRIVSPSFKHLRKRGNGQ